MRTRNTASSFHILEILPWALDADGVKAEHDDAVRTMATAAERSFILVCDDYLVSLWRVGNACRFVVTRCEGDFWKRVFADVCDESLGVFWL